MIYNAKHYRKQDIKEGDFVTPAKYLKYDGNYEIWGTVIDAKSNFFCLVKCEQIIQNDVITEIPSKNQYITSINFWKGGEIEEEQYEYI